MVECEAESVSLLDDKNAEDIIDFYSSQEIRGAIVENKGKNEIEGMSLME